MSNPFENSQAGAIRTADIFRRYNSPTPAQQPGQTVDSYSTTVNEHRLNRQSSTFASAEARAGRVHDVVGSVNCAAEGRRVSRVRSIGVHQKHISELEHPSDYFAKDDITTNRVGKLTFV